MGATVRSSNFRHPTFDFLPPYETQHGLSLNEVNLVRGFECFHMSSSKQYERVLEKIYLKSLRM